MSRPKKPVYSCLCAKCKKIVRTRPLEVAQMALVHYQMNSYASGKMPNVKRDLAK